MHTRPLSVQFDTKLLSVQFDTRLCTVWDVYVPEQPSSRTMMTMQAEQHKQLFGPIGAATAA